MGIYPYLSYSVINPYLNYSKIDPYSVARRYATGRGVVSFYPWHGSVVRITVAFTRATDTVRGVAPKTGPWQMFW